HRHAVAHRRRRLRDGRIGGVRGYRVGDRYGALVEDAAERDAVMGAAMRGIRTRLRRLYPGEDGTTLVETSIASGILLVTLAGLMGMGAIATMHTENQGHLAPRTSEYAQDKMEQLLSLAYSDAASDTVQFPALSAGGSGLAVGGSTNTAAPVSLYV